jgi:hypothetical protein
MDEKAEKITIEKQSLVKAVLELERQTELKNLILLECLSQMRGILERVETTLMEDRTDEAKTTLFNLFVSDTGWKLILTDEQIAAWKAEFVTHFTAL